MQGTMPVHPVSLKTTAQLGVMAENARLLYRLFEELHPFVKPGSTGIRIQEFCLEFYRRQGLRSLVQGYRDFPAQVCISRNEVAAHGLPDLVPLVPGDLVTVDLAASRRGFCADAAWTYLVPGGDSSGKGLLVAAWSACLAGVRAGGERLSLAAIGHAARQACEPAGFRVIPRFAGHGLGRHLHEEPHFAFLGQRQADDRLAGGMVLNVEPVIAPAAVRDEDVRLQADGWSWACPPGQRAAQFELSLALCPEGGWTILNFPECLRSDPCCPPFY